MPVINSNSISAAWKQVASLCLGSNKHEVYGLSVEIQSGDWTDDLAFRAGLNRILAAAGKASVETVARTIFPIGLWNRERPRSVLFERYFKILRKLRRYRQNNRGLYFERLINYPSDREGKKVTNQLEFIIHTYTEKGNHRRSALQASLYNPFLDASDSPRLGFPCLQQVGFLPDDRGNLTIVGFYPLHYIFERAYGNYLGLVHLGQFMAKEMGLNLARVVCIAGVASFEAPKGAVGSLKLA